MTEITITKNERKFLLLLKEYNSLQFHTVENKISREIFDSSARTLDEKKYVDALFNEQNQCAHVTLMPKGITFLLEHPKAKNSFLTDNRKWIIGAIMIPILIFIGGLIFKLFIS